MTPTLRDAAQQALEALEAVSDYQADMGHHRSAITALRTALYGSKLGDGCCYQAAKSEADEVLLRQALDTLAYWLEHGETPGSHDMIQRTHDALQERLK